MSKSTHTSPAPRQVWAKPRLIKLGTIADVTANNNVISIQNPAKS